MRKKLWIFAVIVCMTIGLSGQAFALYLTGGDAASQVAADVIVDIVFATDTSASMNDEILAISNSMQSIIANLDCPDCDAWIRARLMGITGTSNAFNETVIGYVSGKGGTPISNHPEDNGPAVTDLVNWYNWNDDSTATQDYYKAVVTIGDEGTEDGYPSNQADWDASFVANAAAIADDIMVFSLIGTPWPSYVANAPHRDAVFTAMAEGGSGGGHTFGDTGGLAIFTTSNSLETDIEDIICITAGGGVPVPEPSTMLLLGSGLFGLASFRKKFKK